MFHFRLQTNKHVAFVVIPEFVRNLGLFVWIKTCQQDKTWMDDRSANWM